TWSSVVGATSYTIYVSDNNVDFYEVTTLAGQTTLQFTDDGSITTSPFKTAPSSNSTAGPVFTWMYIDVPSNQVFGVTSTNQLYYSAPGTQGAADFGSL